MENKILKIKDFNIQVHSYNTVVVGTGAAGYNAADRLFSLGNKEIAIVTEHINAGTSRNTGSDKQTYYKLTLEGAEPDSVREMAETLFSGECMDGDHALCEAALSPQCFLNLASLGVDFPKNRYGEYVGYKTDHDPRTRATSVGPYTSKSMTEHLQKSVESKNIPVYDKLQVIKILTDGEKAVGLLCLNRADTENLSDRLVAFNCKNIVYATGGPAGIYKDSVYPNGHFGATGTAFEAGVKGKNLTEWQYGLASVRPRWNVSGTYMQVLPRFVSTDKDGNDEREFLFDFFSDKYDMLNKVFLKGYQWPFDVRKIKDGSSIIDILVYMESSKGRRVFLDFRTNSKNESIDFEKLEPDVKEYLTKAGADFGTPIQRLAHMNKPAIDFYLDKGVSLETEMLEIALCAQHNNGGLDVDLWWQTNIEGFFAVGEASGTHGVYRPGGSALNSGQVGSTRAAQYICQKRMGEPLSHDTFEKKAFEQICDSISLIEATTKAKGCDAQSLWKKTAQEMSINGAAIRSKNGIEQTLALVKQLLDNFESEVTANPVNLHIMFRFRDMLICQLVYLEAMKDYIENSGKSRGSALYTDEKGEKPYDVLPDIFTFTLDDSSRKDLVQEAVFNKDKGCTFNWRKVRDIPQDDNFFENVWRSYRENKNIY